MRLHFGKHSVADLVSYYLRIGNVEDAIIAYIFYLRLFKHGKVTLTWLLNACRKIGINVSQTRVTSLLTTWRVHKLIENIGRGVYVAGKQLELDELAIESARRELVLRIGEEKVKQIEEVALS